MDWIGYSSRGMVFLKKYKYIILAIIAGLLLLNLPEESPTEEIIPKQQQIPSHSSLEESLEEILSLIAGAGRVEVLLTQLQGEETVYQMDEDRSTDEHSANIRKDTVLISGSDRTEIGLVRQKIPPVYLGAIVLCQGADKAGIRLSIVEAVMSVTGLTSDKITVLKMK